MVRNDQGEVQTELALDEKLREGVVAMTHGFGNAGTSGMPVAQSMPGVNVNVLSPVGPGQLRPARRDVLAHGHPRGGRGGLTKPCPGDGTVRRRRTRIEPGRLRRFRELLRCRACAGIGVGKEIEVADQNGITSARRPKAQRASDESVSAFTIRVVGRMSSSAPVRRNRTVPFS